jgi:hypothetical protein
MSEQDTTESTDMGGAGSGGDSAAGTGVPPGGGGPGGQPIAPVAPRKKTGSGKQAHGGDETGDIRGGVPRPGAAGAREDDEAGGTSVKSRQDEKNALLRIESIREVLNDGNPHPSASG